MISYGKSKKLNTVEFRLNSDDYSNADIKKVSAYLKSNQYNFVYRRSYSKTKLMSWGCYTLTMNRAFGWKENKEVAERIVATALK